MRPSLPGETGRHSAQQLIPTLNREKEGGIFLIFEGEEDIYLRRADSHQALHSFFFGGMWRVVLNFCAFEHFSWYETRSFRTF